MKLFDLGLADNTAELNREFAELSERYADIKTQVGFLKESADSVAFLASMIEQISARFDAAKRGLGLVNKLTPGQSKRKHASRVMINLNTIRRELAQLTKTLQREIEQESDFRNENPEEDGPDRSRLWTDTSAE
jgi:hypothetical protein